MTVRKLYNGWNIVDNKKMCLEGSSVHILRLTPNRNSQKSNRTYLYVNTLCVVNALRYAKFDYYVLIRGRAVRRVVNPNGCKPATTRCGDLPFSNFDDVRNTVYCAVVRTDYFTRFVAIVVLMLYNIFIYIYMYYVLHTSFNVII